MAEFARFAGILNLPIPNPKPPELLNPRLPTPNLQPMNLEKSRALSQDPALRDLFGHLLQVGGLWNEVLGFRTSVFLRKQYMVWGERFVCDRLSRASQTSSSGCMDPVTVRQSRDPVV